MRSLLAGRDVSEEVENNRRLIAEHPGVVTRGNVEDLVRRDLGVLAIVHLDGEPSRQQELKMVDLAERLVGFLAQMRRPSETRLNGRVPESQRPNAKQVQRHSRQLANLVGLVDALALDAGHHRKGWWVGIGRSSETCPRARGSGQQALC